ncbi:MAG: FxLYD domain-containing protein [Candidatus Harrisonbacteria bacterium]|nr:FxLYD domain-containing protein [Candidatus Harrisonbacteria bacterium]
MPFRTIKQIIYALFYLLIIAALGYGLYAIAIQPSASCSDGKKNQGEEKIDCGGPCQSCALKEAEPLRALPAVVIATPDGSGSTLISQFRNPNSAFGARSFDYSISLFGSQGELVEQIQDSSFIYGAEVKFVIRPNIAVLAERVQSSEISIANVEWVSREDFPQPRTELRSVSLEISEEKLNRVEAIVHGTIRNDNAYSLSRVIVNARLTDRIGALAGASRTVVENVEPFSEAEFTIIIPITEEDIEGLSDPVVTVEALR